MKAPSGASVWLRDLNDGSKAVGIFNRTNNAISMALNLRDIGLTGKFSARQIWEGKDIGMMAGPREWTIPSHGALLLKLQPGSQ